MLAATFSSRPQRRRNEFPPPCRGARVRQLARKLEASRNSSTVTCVSVLLFWIWFCNTLRDIPARRGRVGLFGAHGQTFTCRHV